MIRNCNTIFMKAGSPFSEPPKLKGKNKKQKEKKKLLLPLWCN